MANSALGKRHQRGSVAAKIAMKWRNNKMTKISAAISSASKKYSIIISGVSA
jgi:hypothetical protein